MKILDGRIAVEELYRKLPDGQGKKIGIVRIGDDYGSKLYTKNIIKCCDRVNLVPLNIEFGDDAKIDEIISTITKINNDDDVIGIILQSPYPEPYKAYNIEDLISPNKDIDGACSYNMVRTLSGRRPINYPSTPSGIITLLDYYKIPIEGKNAVVIGRSDIVGKPLSAMLTARNATVTLCHSKTDYLIEHTINADIIISAVGKPKFINSDHITYYDEHVDLVSRNPVIIDVGINRDNNGKLCGDVDYDEVLPHVSGITPIIGGVGVMTIYSLLKNALKNMNN